MARIEIYSSNLCPYCRQAIKLLKGKGIAFESKPIIMLPMFKWPNRNFREMRSRSGGQTTVPQIFIDGEYYGDDDTLAADMASGRLEALLAE